LTSATCGQGCSADSARGVEPGSRVARYSSPGMRPPRDGSLVVMPGRTLCDRRVCGIVRPLALRLWQALACMVEGSAATGGTECLPHLSGYGTARRGPPQSNTG